ncbi:MAG: ISAzo13 family transposase, partial [Actinobacteria bacterium]|nr:ISAzo13 family transposase [Actinomycetota bacterium]
MKQELNERQWRHYLAMEALRIGSGGIRRVMRDSGADFKTIKRGIREVRAGESYTPGDRVRSPGGGRKKLSESDESLLADLEALLEPKGDPTSLLRWTTKSLSHLERALAQMGHTIKKSALANLLHELGFSLKANKKNIEGISHPDRDEQFRHIDERCKAFEKLGEPIICVDCKKKELLGDFKNGGREWQAKGKKNTSVNVYDYRSLSSGKAVPYGVYDLVYNTGFVNVGIGHDTAEFAVESIRRWWETIGNEIYPEARNLLITADGGGSNGGVRNRLWKRELQRFSNESGLWISVCHYPPATSKWNKIEHRLFSYISINWRAKPTVSLETVIELLSHTSTKEGLTVSAMLDQNIYPTGIKVTDDELNRINIVPDSFHGEWNYTI